MEDKELIRQMMNTINESFDPASDEEKKEVLKEGVNITLDGPEADEFVNRLLQLSGAPATPVAVEPVPMDSPIGAQIDASVAHDIDLPVAHDISEPAGIPIDAPEVDADHYVCDTCEEAPCACPEDELALENADFDYGTEEHDEDGEEVEVDTYMFKPSQAPQRLVKGTMGDNPLLTQESQERFSKIVNEYVKFLNESENEDGHASPLTADSRNEFDKDQNAGDEPKDDGSMSPMSQIKRQDVMK